MPSIDLSYIDIPPPTTLQEVRTSRLRKFGSVLSGIDKKAQKGRLSVSALGISDDEHDLTFHGGVDKAIHQYCSSHYDFWKSLYLGESGSSGFTPGGFGENLVADGIEETNICIGDLVRVGPKGLDLVGGANGCLLEVSLPRQPCFKLNQRFGIKNFAPKTVQHAKTGWYYRVKEEGSIEAGMEIRVIQRPHPKWSIARLHHYVHRDMKDMSVTKELMSIDVMGHECRKIFKRRWEQDLKRRTKTLEKKYRDMQITSKTLETPRIVRLELRALRPSTHPSKIYPGSYATLKLPNGLERAYSVVNGNTDCFILGVARDDNSRGGSVYIHDKLKAGDIISLGGIQRSIEPSGMASHSIFVVGGIGITAFLDMMKRQFTVNQTLELHYAVRATDEVAFRSLLQEIGPHVHIYDKSKGERMNIDHILRNRVWNSQVFTCGPQRMIDAVIASSAAAGMAQDEVYYESFAADRSGDPFSVDVVSEGQTTRLEVKSDVSLLETMRDAGFEISSSCESGLCGSCRVPVRCGEILHRGSGLTTEEKNSEMLSCVSRGIGHIVVEQPEA